MLAIIDDQCKLAAGVKAAGRPRRVYVVIEARILWNLDEHNRSPSGGRRRITCVSKENKLDSGIWCPIICSIRLVFVAHVMFPTHGDNFLMRLLFVGVLLFLFPFLMIDCSLLKLAPNDGKIPD